MPATELPDQLVPAARVRDLFGLSEQTLRNWINAGKLPPPIRVGNRTFWEPADLREFLDRSRQGAGTGGNAA